LRSRIRAADSTVSSGVTVTGCFFMISTTSLFIPRRPGRPGPRRFVRSVFVTIPTSRSFSSTGRRRMPRRFIRASAEGAGLSMGTVMAGDVIQSRTYMVPPC
jgi:hypothetical protein